MMDLHVFSMRVRMEKSMSLLSSSMISTAILLLYLILLCAGNTSATISVSVGSSSLAAYANEIRTSTVQDQASPVSSFYRGCSRVGTFPQVWQDSQFAYSLLFQDMFVCTWDPRIGHAGAIVWSVQIGKRTVTGVRKLFGSYLFSDDSN